MSQMENSFSMGSVEEMDGYKLSRKVNLVEEVKELKEDILKRLDSQNMNNGQLEEEWEIRKQIQLESQRLVTEIKSSYENKLSQLKAELKNKEEKIINEKDQEIKEKKKKISSLENNLAALRKASTMWENELTDFENIIANKKKELELAEAARSRLADECLLLKDQLKKSRNEINEAKSLNTFVEKRLNEVEGGLQDHEKHSRNQIQSLTQELKLAEAARSQLADECLLLKDQLKKSINEINEAKILKTIVEKRLNQVEGGLQDNEKHSRNQIQSLTQKLEDLKITNETLARSVESLNRDLQTIQTEKKDLEGLVEKMKNTNLWLHKEKTRTLDSMSQLKSELQKKEEQIINEKDQEVKEKNEKIASLEYNLAALRKASTMLDNQLTGFETVIANKKKDLEVAEAARSQLAEECLLLKDQLKKSRIEINEAKSLKTFVEKRLNEVESDLQDHEKHSRNQIQSLTHKLEDFKITNETLARSVESLNRDLQTITAEKKDLEELVQKLKDMNLRLNQEIARTLDSMVDLKDENITLKFALEDAVKKAESYKSLSEILTKDHEVMDVDRYEREVQLQSTVSQQLKLIEYLQDQNEALTKKKGASKFNLFSKPKDDHDYTPTSSKYHGHSRPHPTTPAVTPVRLVHEHRAVQSLEEKAASLKQQLALLHDSKDVKTQKDIILPTPRKEECILLHEARAIESNNIDHRFREKTVMKTEKCWGCMEPIYFSRTCSACSNCPAVFHIRCGISAEKSCGLSKEDIIKLELSRNPDRTLLTEDEDDEFIESSVFVCGETEWEQHRVQIKDGKLLMYGENKTNTQPLKKFPLNGKTRVELRINKSEVPVPIPHGKLPYVLKVVTPPEVGLRAWDDYKCLFIMTNNNDQKRFWTRAIFKNSTYKGSSTTIDSEDLLLDMKNGTSISGIRKTALFRSTDNRLDINCAYVVSKDLYLMGCESGLYSHKVISSQPSTIVKVEGVDAIYQMEHIMALNSVVMIEGESRRLVMVHMGVLRVCAEAAACSQPKLTVDEIADIQSCHLFQVQVGVKGEVYIAAATPKHLHVLQWDGNAFVQKKRINTKETVTCIQMTQNSVIFGSDRVYELDIKNFQLEEFIDYSDDSMYYIRFACDMFNSFPVAILDVGMSNWNPVKGSSTPEYLLCFPDLGVFVDSYGRRTRGEDIVWSKLPLAVAYRHPNIFVLHFSSVEIIRLESDSYTRTRVIEDPDSIGKEYVFVPDSRFLYLTSPRFLGYGGKTASIVVSALEKQKTEMFELDLEWNTSQ